MLASAIRICEANFGNLHLYQDGAFPIVTQHGVPAAYATCAAATRGSAKHRK